MRPTFFKNDQTPNGCDEIILTFLFQRIVTDCLRQHLARDDFLKFEKYIHHKREILKEQYMIEERIKGAELILKQLKES